MRKLFVCFCICVILLWSAIFLRFGFQTTPRLLPDLLENVDRFRSDRVCAPLATILVNSAPWHASLRQVIRETWGHPSVLRPLGLGLVFGVGAESPVQLEAAACGDVLQYPGEGGYRGLPKKIAWLLRRVETACHRRPFVVKMDDDVFVNVHALQKVLLELTSNSSEKKLWCLVWEGMPVVRANHSKWFVSRDAYSESLYPTYCSGAAYVLSAPALQGILQHENTSLTTSENKQRPRGNLQHEAPLRVTSRYKARLSVIHQDPSEQNAHLRLTSEGNAHSKVSKDESQLLETSEYNDLGGMSNDYSRLQVSSEANDRPLAMTEAKLRPLGMSEDNARPLVTSEDVYITGLLARKAGVMHVQLGTRFAFESFDQDRISDGRTVFAHLGPEAEERIEELWDSVQKHRRKSKGDELDKGL